MEVELVHEKTSVAATMVGTVQVELPGSTTPATQATVRAQLHVPSSKLNVPSSMCPAQCAQLKAPGSPLDGLRLYAPKFPVAGWAWNDRPQLRLLADLAIKATAALAQPLASLKLADEPAVSLMHVGWYQWARTA